MFKDSGFPGSVGFVKDRFCLSRLVWSFNCVSATELIAESEVSQEKVEEKKKGDVKQSDRL